MSFGIEYVRLIQMIERMIHVEEKEEILGSLAKKEAFHPVALLSTSDILNSCPSALRPASPLDVSKNHLCNVDIPRVLCCSVKMVRRFDKLRPTRPPPKTAFYSAVASIPSLRECGIPGPYSCGQEMSFNCFIHMAR
jgi:hypothetical protein